MRRETNPRFSQEGIEEQGIHGDPVADPVIDPVKEGQLRALRKQLETALQEKKAVVGSCEEEYNTREIAPKRNELRAVEAGRNAAIETCKRGHDDQKRVLTARAETLKATERETTKQARREDQGKRKAEAEAGLREIARTRGVAVSAVENEYASKVRTLEGELPELAAMDEVAAQFEEENRKRILEEQERLANIRGEDPVARVRKIDIEADIRRLRENFRTNLGEAMGRIKRGDRDVPWDRGQIETYLQLRDLKKTGAPKEKLAAVAAEYDEKERQARGAVFSLGRIFEKELTAVDAEYDRKVNTVATEINGLDADLPVRIAAIKREWDAQEQKIQEDIEALERTLQTKITEATKNIDAEIANIQKQIKGVKSVLAGEGGVEKWPQEEENGHHESKIVKGEGAIPDYYFDASRSEKDQLYHVRLVQVVGRNTIVAGINPMKPVYIEESFRTMDDARMRADKLAETGVEWIERQKTA